MSAKRNDDLTTNSSGRPRIFLVEDDPSMHLLLSMMIERSEEMELERGVTTATEAQSFITQSRADLVLLDWHLPDGTSADLLPEIHKARPGIKVLLMSSLFEADRVSQALAAGARGFVNKLRLDEDLFEGIRTVLRGERFVSPPLDQLLRPRCDPGDRPLDGAQPPM